MRLYIQFLLLFLIVACTKSKKVDFPSDQDEYSPPKVVKATPTIHPIPDSLSKVQYVWKSGKLTLRDKIIPLKKPQVAPVSGQLNKVDAGFKSYTVADSLPFAEYIWDNKKRKLVLRDKKTPLALPKSRLAGAPKVLPAKGKVIIAGAPTVVPFGQPIMKDKDLHGILYVNQDEGLPGAEASCFAKDTHGRIWVGTGNGLALIEGNQVKVYTTKQGLSGNNIKSLAVDGDKLWIGTVTGLNLLENGTFTHYGKENGLLDNDVFSLAVDGDKLWIGTYTGLHLLKNGKFTYYNKESGLSDHTIRSLLVDRGKLWIGTVGGLNLFENNRFTHYTTQNGLSRNSIRSLALDGNKLWVGTQGGGLNLLENGKFTHYNTENGLSGNDVRSILVDQGKLWVGTRTGGVSLLEDNRFTYFNANNGLSSNYVVSLLKEGKRLWVGTKGGGVSFLKKGEFVHYTKDNGLPSDYILSLLPDNDKIWIGTLGGGLAYLKDNEFTHYTTQNGLSNNSVWSLVKREGKLWASTNKGINVLEDNQFSYYTNQNGLSINVAGFFAPKGDKLWFGTYGGGLNYLENGQFNQYVKDNGLISNAISAILQGKNKLWIGTIGGMACLENNQFKHYTKENGLSSNFVHCFLEEKDRLWIGTVGGLNCLENGQFTHYTTENGLADNSVTQLAVDSLNQIWVGTERGLTRLKPKKNGGYSIKTWTKNHGLKFIDFRGLGNPMFFDAKGKLWASIGQGITAFKPSAADTIAPKVFITAVDISQKKVSWQKLSSFQKVADTLYTIKSDTLLANQFPPDTSWLSRAGIKWDGVEGMMPSSLPKKLTLPYNQNHLTFHYSGLKYGEQGDIVYRYILEGLDKKWSSFTKEGKVDYRNIPPGRYVFKVRAKARNHIWSKEVGFAFRVKFPWWQTWWAYILYGLAGALLVYGFAVLRTRNLKATQRKLEQIVDKRTTDLREANEHLTFQKEEIAFQKDEITTQNEELRQSQEELEAQRDYIEERNKELTKKNMLINQSIKAALNIQQALLPSEQLFEDSFSEYFTFFKPRDIVSGDFYWLNKSDDTIWIAVADCTGHGVPGAFMTMLGKSLLERLINVRKLETPAEVLQELDKEVILTLRQRETKNNTGMDIILLKITKGDTPNVLYAGAKNSLFVVDSNNEITEHKADRISIGGIKRRPDHFTNQTISVTSESHIFLGTDGYQDQNDVKRKSFSKKRLRALLQEVSLLPSVEQKQALLATTLDAHMQDTEQRDDILVVGIRL
ncbi:hypothetical protein BKI52_43375 [marine bacterium AO1-C]|nr:hypothetical protein BKI52_43375 [marine bacterium AO1-C]